MGRKSRMLVFALDAVHRLMQMKGITDDDLREAGIGVRTIQRFHTLCNFRALPSTYMKRCKVLGCKKSDITYWQGYEMPESYYDEQERRPRRCVVCGKMFIPFTTTRRPDGTLSVAGWDYCSFQCCEEDNPEFKRERQPERPGELPRPWKQFHKKKKALKVPVSELFSPMGQSRDINSVFIITHWRHPN